MSYKLTFTTNVDREIADATSADLYSSATIEVRGLNIVVHYPVAFAAACDRIRWQASGGNLKSAVIGAMPRNRDTGWLEWLIIYTYASGSTLTVGMVQRTPDSEFEFHS